MEGKFQAVMRDIKERHEKGQPVLVGTIAVETSEYLSELLTRQGIPHNVLNAKEHAREAETIKDAGQSGAVTIATNMAGRGVDIKLGEGVVEAGGLYVLATERHEARRIDNQLRGRSGRQGDPGESRFYLSGEDDLVRLFAGDRIKRIMERFKIPDDQPMEAKILSSQIEGAQKKVEEQNFVARKNVLKYDDVMNSQRMVIYEQRRAVLEGQDMSDQVREWIDEVIARTVAEFTQEDYAEEWDLEGLVKQMAALYDTEVTVDELREDIGEVTRESLDGGIPGGRARLVHREGRGADDRPDARARALRDPSGRRPALARASRLDGLPARGRPPARDGAEGSARRVPARRPHHVRGARVAQIREEVVLTLFHAQLAPEEAEELQRAQQAQAVNGSGLQYAHESLAGAEAIAAAGGGAARHRHARDVGRQRHDVDRRSAAPDRQVGAARTSAATTRAGAAAARSSRSATARRSAKKSS